MLFNGIILGNMYSIASYGPIAGSTLCQRSPKFTSSHSEFQRVPIERLEKYVQKLHLSFQTWCFDKHKKKCFPHIFPTFENQ